MRGPPGTQAVVPPDDLVGLTAGILQKDPAVRLVAPRFDKVLPDAAEVIVLFGIGAGFVPRATVEGVGRLGQPRD